MKKTFAFFCILTVLFPLFAAYNRLEIPDSAEIRSELQEKWFTAPLSSVRQNLPEIRANKNGEKFQIRMEEDESTFNIFVAPHVVINVKVFSDMGFYEEKQNVYPGDAIGSWVLIRDKKTGKPLRIRYYFVKNSEVFIQFTPNGKNALVDLMIYGNYAARGVPTGMPFEKFYEASIEDVLVITEKKIPWNYVIVDTSVYHSVKQMCAVIRENLPRISFVPDAMYNEENELVHISNGKSFDTVESSFASASANPLYLSSAGFLKWIADGLIEPIAGGMLKREPLIMETVEVKDIGHQGVLSQRYDLFFSLNWIRNLASAVISVYSGKTYLFNQSGVDVTVNPFASTFTPKGVANTVTFVENTGYNVAMIRSLLYVLAATESGTFYLGAIRGIDRTVMPEVKAFNDCVAFFPYFLDDGAFECNVFMNGREMSLEDFCLQNEQNFVYLTRIKTSERFFPR